MSERCTLRSLLENLGADIVQVVTAPAGLDVAVRHPVIDDPADPPPVESGDVLLAVGTPASSSAAPAVVERAGRGGASAVVFRHVDSNPTPLVTAAESACVAVLVAVPEMAWSQLHTLMRTAVAASGSSCPEGEAAGAIGDLFGLANAIAAMVGGPTTIEDPQSTVLAYSSLDNPIDDARRQTILGRRVPEEWMQRLRDDGVFRRLWGRDEVVRIEYPEEQPELRRRLAIAVRAGGEVLGSIWVAEDERPLDANAEAALLEASRIAALHLLRARAGEDLQRSGRSTLLRAMLDGHAVGRLLADALEADETEHVTVIGFKLPPESVPDLAVQGRRACRLLDLYCESTRRRGSSVAVGQVVYLLLVDAAPPAIDRLEALASEVAGRDGQMLRRGTIAGIGSSYAGFSSVPASRIEADRVLAVLTTLEPGRTVGTIHGVRGHAILLRLKELVASEPDLLKGHIEILEAHDAGGRGQYTQTLRAYLDAFGDVPTAAAALDVHPNTFRYRMRRLTEVSGLVLDDPVERLVAHLQLHLG
jgi:hypothetical protein